MPTPYGSRGGMAFSADELRVLRGALAAALQSSPASAAEAGEMLQLAEALDEAEREGHRLRSFLLADLARYRAALPGSAAGYLDQLEDALAGGYLPRPDDLDALRALAGERTGQAESARRAELLQRCRRLAEQAVRARLLVLPGGSWCTPELAAAARGLDGAGPRGAEDRGAEYTGAEYTGAEYRGAEEKPRKEPKKEPPREPRREPRREPQKPSSPTRRPVPTPGEVFPPRKRPAAPPQEALPA